MMRAIIPIVVLVFVMMLTPVFAVPSLYPKVTITCNPSSPEQGQKTTCTATITYIGPSDGPPPTPTGTISWTSDNGGIFSSPTCTLSSGSCSVSFAGNTGQQTTIIAEYSGDSTYYRNSATIILNVSRLPSLIATGIVSGMFAIFAVFSLYKLSQARDSEDRTKALMMFLVTAGFAIIVLVFGGGL